MKVKWKNIVFGVLFILIGIILFSEYNELKNIKFDGTGIGIYLLDFIEINDRVPNNQVSFYAYGFIAASFIFFAAAIYNLYKVFSKKGVDGKCLRIKE